MKKLDARTIVMIAMFVAIAFVLNSIKIISMPYDGSVSLCSMMPIMLLAALLGNKAGLLGGFVLGLLSMIDGVYFIHPVQFLLDYILPYTLLGVAGIWGWQNKAKLCMGAVIAVLLSVSCNILSGGIYFGAYAPEGMNPWVYSIVYNMMTNGLEGLLSIVLLMVMPLKQFALIVSK